MKKLGLVFFIGTFFFGILSQAQMTIPTMNLGFKTTDNPNEIVSAIRLILIMTVLTLAPAILIMMTAFTRIVIVFSFLRQAVGVPQLPPNQILIGLSLFLTLFIMGPAFKEINETGVQPFMAGKMSQDDAISASLAPLRKFMFSQTRESDLSLFVQLAKNTNFGYGLTIVLLYKFAWLYRNLNCRIYLPIFSIR